MNIIFDKQFYETYDFDPAAAPGRMEPIIRELERHPQYTMIPPKPAGKEDIMRAHSQRQYHEIKADPVVYEMAMLAAGGAIAAAESGYSGKPAFACIRPPGHHASYDRCWGFCFFNNMAVSLLKLKAEGKINRASILDFDLHTGDGTLNILGSDSAFTIVNPHSRNEEAYLQEVAEALSSIRQTDIVAASAGFDEYIKDWGHNLSTEAYRHIGSLLRSAAEKHCQGRRYALLEGGYCYEDLGINIHAFCEGFR